MTLVTDAGPETWAMPCAPGIQVIAIRDRYRLIWLRIGLTHSWRLKETSDPAGVTWEYLLYSRGPLLNVSGEEHG
jgi:hypothetical protein